MDLCALCEARPATIGRTCDACSRRLLSHLGDVESDARDLSTFGSVLGAVRAKGDPYSYRGTRGFSASTPADLRVIAARDPRTRLGDEPGDRLFAPAEVLADWADALRDEVGIEPGDRGLDASVRLLRTGHSRLCAAGWLADYADELAELRGFLGGLPTSTRDHPRRPLGNCLAPECPGRVWSTEQDPRCDTCGDTYDARRLALLAIEAERAAAVGREDEVTVPAAAERFDVLPQTIRVWMQRGHVRVLRRSLGRVYVSAGDVERRAAR